MVKRKAINYRGTSVTKDLFNKYIEEKKNNMDKNDNKSKKNEKINKEGKKDRAEKN